MMSMRFFRRREDPLRSREQEIRREVRALESRIHGLSGKGGRRKGPKFRSTVLPYGAPVPEEPMVFEPTDGPGEEAVPRPEQVHYNEQGVPKLDLVRLWQRWIGGRPEARKSHSRLVDYLASGSFQGARPLRYERRIARNRFLLLLFFLLMILFGIISLLQNGSF